MRRTKISDITRIGLMTVIIAICSWITVPFLIPFTLQTFGIFLSLKILGAKKGTISILVYILIGMAGVPVFSGFRGGFGHIMGPTGGFIVGFLFSGILYWIFEKGASKNKVFGILKMIVSLMVCYVFGSLWFYVSYGKMQSMSISRVMLLCVVPFILPDILKILLADYIAEKVKKHISI